MKRAQIVFKNDPTPAHVDCERVIVQTNNTEDVLLSVTFEGDEGTVAFLDPASVAAIFIVEDDKK